MRNWQKFKSINIWAKYLEHFIVQNLHNHWRLCIMKCKTEGNAVLEEMNFSETVYHSDSLSMPKYTKLKFIEVALFKVLLLKIPTQI